MKRNPEEIKMIKRSPEEIQAYVEGYNASFKQFCECLKGRKSVTDSVRKMQIYVDMMNKIVMWEDNDDSRPNN